MPMDNLTAIITLASELITLAGVITPMMVKIGKVSNGTKCQLRSEMLHIYYKGAEKKVIRQYEYENFLMLYEAYKALKGNSFVDKIKAEVDEWQVVT